MNLQQLHDKDGGHIWKINTKVKPPIRRCMTCGVVDIFNTETKKWERYKNDKKL